MTKLHARSALLVDGWHRDVVLTLSAGRIVSIETGVDPEAGGEIHAVIVPAVPNLHSHAFQRAMAGLAEVRGPSSDSFWSWRTVMYKFALSMTAGACRGGCRPALRGNAGGWILACRRVSLPAP